MRAGRRCVTANEGKEGIGYVEGRELAGFVEGVVIGGGIVAVDAVAAGARSGCRELGYQDIFASGGVCNWSNSRVMSDFVVV